MVGFQLLIWLPDLTLAQHNSCCWHKLPQQLLGGGLNAFLLSYWRWLQWRHSALLLHCICYCQQLIGIWGDGVQRPQHWQAPAGRKDMQSELNYYNC